MKAITKALNILNNTSGYLELDVEKANVYTLIAIYEELKLLNQMLAAKFNIEFIKEDEESK